MVTLPILAFAGFACGESERSEVGVILEVDAISLTEVESFTLLIDGGQVVTFQIAPDATSDPEEGFFPGHLREHALVSQEVEVFYQEQDGQRLAQRLTHD